MKNIRDLINKIIGGSNLQDSIKEAANNCDDLVIRNIKVKSVNFYLFFLEEFTDTLLIQEHILEPLLNEGNRRNKAPDLLEIKNSILPLREIYFAKSVDEALENLFGGNTLLLKENENKLLVINTIRVVERAVSDPSIETVVRGPRDSFTENIKTNVNLIRRRIKNKRLKVENFIFGKITKTQVSVLYMEEIVLPDLLKEIKERLKRIDIDGIFESGYIEQFIEDSPFSPFPQTLYTERPDKVASSLLEGRVAIVTDGTPLVLIIPATFNEFFISSEDYYERFLYGSFIRFFRFVASMIGLFISSFYVAFSSFHPDLLPLNLALALAAGRVNVPFPPILEILIMEVTAEILREASIRLPGQIGPTLSIVGALVLGEAAVSASLVSPTLVIVVALTTLGNIAIPIYSAGASLRLLRFFLLFITFFFGLYGLVMGFIIILIHLVSLKSFGTPYLVPYTPFRVMDLKDTLIRLPLWLLTTRPRYLRPLDKKRQGRGKKNVRKK